MSPRGKHPNSQAALAMHSRQWWDEDVPVESEIYGLTLKQIKALLERPTLKEQVRVRLLLAVLRWQGKFETNSEKHKAFADLISITRGVDESDAVPEEPEDPGQGQGSDPLRTELGAEPGDR